MAELKIGDICERLISFVSEVLLTEGESAVRTDDRLFEDGIIDSLGILELVEFIEDTYEITVEDVDVDLENFRSIGAIAEFVLRRLSDSDE